MYKFSVTTAISVFLASMFLTSSVYAGVPAVYPPDCTVANVISADTSADVTKDDKRVAQAYFYGVIMERLTNLKIQNNNQALNSNMEPTEDNATMIRNSYWHVCYSHPDYKLEQVFEDLKAGH